jgi:hypothetical protein
LKTAKDKGVFVFKKPFHFLTFSDLGGLGQSGGEIDIEGFCRPALDALDFDFMTHFGFLVDY